MISFDTFLAAAALTGVLAGPPSALTPDQGATRTGRNAKLRAAIAKIDATRRVRRPSRRARGSVR